MAAKPADGLSFPCLVAKKLNTGYPNAPGFPFFDESSVRFLPRYVLGMANIPACNVLCRAVSNFCQRPSTFEGNDNLRVVLQLSIFVFLGIAVAALAYLLLPKILRYYASLLATVAAWFSARMCCFFPRLRADGIYIVSQAA